MFQEKTALSSSEKNNVFIPVPGNVTTDSKTRYHCADE